MPRLMLLLLSAWLASAAPLIIRHVNLVDLNSATILRDRVVRIDGSRITAVGTSVLIPRDATILDARGKFLMPGLVGELVGDLDLAPHQLVAKGITAIRHRGFMPGDAQAAPRLIDADPIARSFLEASLRSDRTRTARALRAVTVDAVAGTSLEGQLGLIVPGYFADLILLTADPLKDVSFTRKLAAVILNGRLLDRRALDELSAVLINEKGAQVTYGAVIKDASPGTFVRN